MEEQLEFGANERTGVEAAVNSFDTGAVLLFSGVSCFSDFYTLTHS